MGVHSSTGLPRRAAPSRRWRRAFRHRIGPLRSLSEAAPHPVLRGMRSGAIAGLALVAVLSLPVLLVLTVKAPRPVEDEAAAPARVWAVEPVARASAEPPATPLRPAPVVAVAEPLPSRDASSIISGAIPAAAPPEAPRGGVRASRPALSLDLIPVLDDESGALTIEESVGPAAPAIKPPRPSRPAPAKPPKAP